MASTTALFTSRAGLTVNARALDVIGNNIANVNTTAFKSSRMLFAPTFARTFSLGTSPSAVSGGTNPVQVGLGPSIAGTQRNFENGAISATGVPSDIAIEGDGFFVVESGGGQFYTRAGAFQRNEQNDLVTISGHRLMGFGVDDTFQIIEGNLINMNIPIGNLTVAEATRNVTFNGNLNASGVIASTGSVHESRIFYVDAGLTTPLASSNFDLTVPGNDLYIDDGSGGSFLAIEGGAGTIITFSGVEKGGKELEELSFAFANAAVPGTDAFGATLQDFMDFLDEALGLSNASINGETLGGGVSFSNGQVIVSGNEGTVQDLRLETADLIATSNGAGVSQPFVWSKTGDADGESVRTSFVVYDSLGSPLTVDLSFVLQSSATGAGTTWEFIAESSDNDAVDRVIGLGVLQFDSNGVLLSASNDAFALIRGNGAVSPLTVTMEFSSGSDSISALTASNSEVAAVFQDGSPIGTLSAYSIAEDGIILGGFTNGLTRTIGQVALAKFANSAGLADVGDNLYAVGPNSGPAVITSPLDFGTGRLVGGALELSNVDLSQEFINMILASTGYSASSRVITTTDELLQQLLLIGA